MKMHQNQQRAQLQDAFDKFNLVSDSLVTSFDKLNETVVKFSHHLPADRAQRKQHTMTRHLRALLDAIPGAVIVLNAQGRVVDCNLSAKELLAAPLTDELWRDVVSRVFLSELDQGELTTADGRQFSISTRPLGYEPGQIILLNDVTQTRQLQRAAQQNLHLMTMGKMMASLAHQIRTPLSSAMLYLSQIVEGDLPADKNLKFSSRALGRIKHIESMINDMLVFAHGGQFNMSEFRLNDLLEELNEQLKPHLQLRNAGLEIRGQDKPVFINGNKDALLGALANLCMNAIDARDGDLTICIDISLTRKGDLLLTISDNAKGMDANTLKHLFDPFFTTKMDGTGLGLAVVKSVIESHQGSIDATSEVGQGSRFEIHLPCQQANTTQLSHHQPEENRDG